MFEAAGAYHQWGHQIFTRLPFAWQLAFAVVEPLLLGLRHTHGICEHWAEHPVFGPTVSSLRETFDWGARGLLQASGLPLLAGGGAAAQAPAALYQQCCSTIWFARYLACTLLPVALTYGSELLWRARFHARLHGRSSVPRLALALWLAVVLLPLALASAHAWQLLTVVEASAHTGATNGGMARMAGAYLQHLLSASAACPCMLHSWG